MMTDNFWIRAVDHRISTALIFFLLLILVDQKKRQAFALRASLSLGMLCTVSWAIRFAVDILPANAILQGMGYAVHLLCMSLLYWASYAFCYEGSRGDRAYEGLLALTIYKMAWNTFKVCASAGLMSHMRGLWSTYSIMGSIISYIVYIVVCIPAYILHRSFVKKDLPELSEKPMILTYIIFLFSQVVLEFCGRVFTADASARFLYYLCALMYTGINYALIITFSKLAHYRRDYEDMYNFIQNKMQYYQMSREGITSLQIKCHDLKHQIAAIRSQSGKENFEKYIARLEDSLIEYGTVVECGNETINVVLTEKNILCTGCGVKFSYIIDGTIFDFMSEMEIYSLFGNALDNALESCRKVEPPENRVISLKANARGEMVVLHVENTFAESPRLVDGIPVTTKEGSGHGFGLRSIRQIAEKYGGVATVQVEEPIFNLTVIMHPGSSQEA